jgi:thioredoxin reductase (NADPH)
VPGEEKFRGKGILTSGALERSKVAGRRVLIIGGGDAALENAVILSETAESVTVAHRGSRFSARKEFLQEAAKRKNVEFVFECTVNDFIGQDHLSGATLERGGTERSLRAIETDFALIRIGVEPNTDIPGLLPTGASDYMTVDANGQTRFPFVFASGDVANQHSPTIATAIGTGATAAKILFRHLRADGKAA